MFCKQCQKEGKTSRVFMSAGCITAMYCAPFFDEQGKYHHHDSNTSTQEYTCSNGHKWTDVMHGFPCPSCGMTWMTVKQDANQQPTVPPTTATGPDIRAGIAGTGLNGLGVDSLGLQDSNRAVIVADNLPTKNEVPR